MKPLCYLAFLLITLNADAKNYVVVTDHFDKADIEDKITLHYTPEGSIRATPPKVTEYWFIITENIIKVFYFKIENDNGILFLNLIDPDEKPYKEVEKIDRCPVNWFAGNCFDW